MVRLFIISMSLICALAAKGQEIPPSIAKKLLGLPGTYRGRLPCADCSGIETSLTLQCDSLCDHGKYMRIDKYLNTKSGDQTNKIKGWWGFVNNKNNIIVIALDIDDSTKMSFYEVTRKGDLSPVDKNLQTIDAQGDLALKKL